MVQAARIELTEIESDCLRMILKKGSDWRERDRANAGEIELAYVDEAGFAAQPPNRSAWAKSGETHAVTAKRAQRLNVMGAFMSSGKLMIAKLWKSVNGLWFFGFLMALIEWINKPLVVILDNASIHTAKKLSPYWELLEEKVCNFTSYHPTAQS